MQHVVDDVKKTRTAKVIDFTKRLLQRRARPTQTRPSPRATCRAAAARTSGAVDIMNGDMLSGLTGKLRLLAHQQLEAREADRPAGAAAARRGEHRQRSARQADSGRTTPRDAAAAGGPVVVTPAVREQAPVIVYFDGKDQRTKTKVEELLNAREIKFRLLDVTNDEAERSWVITAAKSEEFPIVVIAGTPVGGFHELMQLDVTGELKKRVFGVVVASMREARPQAAGALSLSSSSSVFRA